MILDCVVKITDFGLGKVQEGVSKSILLTGSMLSAAGSSIAGTYDYMAPEQRAGQETGPTADLYAVGLILFELLTGSRPSGSFRRILQRRGIDESLINLIVKATDQLPTRYQTVDSFRTDLERIKLGFPVVVKVHLPKPKAPEPLPPTTAPATPQIDTQPIASISAARSNQTATDAITVASPDFIVQDFELAEPAPPLSEVVPVKSGGKLVWGGLGLAFILAIAFGLMWMNQSSSPPNVETSKSSIHPPTPMGTQAAIPTITPASTPNAVVASNETPTSSTQVASFTFDTDPSNAVLVLDGKESGYTPLLLRISDGKPHIVEIKADGYYPWIARLNPAGVGIEAIPIDLKLDPVAQ